MRLTDLLGAELVTESGERLGHVFDVRVKRDPRSSPERADQKWKLDALLYGERGLIAALRSLRRPRSVCARQTRGAAVERRGRHRAGEITVRDG